jgi:UDP-N-acetyl-2-amino-2-deoxyglucuronate dehydrogenase
MKPLKFLVIGSGHIGKRHAEMIRRHPEAKLLAVCDTKDKRSLDLDNLEEPFYTDAVAMVAAHPDADVVSVATPNGLHAQHCLLALQHKMHVVVEKPMALTKADCEKIIFKSLQVSRQVFCVMQNRYSPPSQWLKTILQEGRLGKIFMVQINCYWNRDDRYYKPDNWKGSLQLDGGTLFTQFSHFIDIMYWLFGDISNIQTKFKDFNHHTQTEFEDSGVVSFDFVDGGMGSINYSTSVWNQNLESSLTIIGEKGTVKVGGQYMNEVQVCHIKDYDIPTLAETNPGNDYGHYKGSANNHHIFYDNVINTLLGRDIITTNALEGLKVVEIIERMYANNTYLGKGKTDV